MKDRSGQQRTVGILVLSFVALLFLVLVVLLCILLFKYAIPSLSSSSDAPVSSTLSVSTSGSDPLSPSSDSPASDINSAPVPISPVIPESECSSSASPSSPESAQPSFTCPYVSVSSGVFYHSSNSECTLHHPDSFVFSREFSSLSYATQNKLLPCLFCFPDFYPRRSVDGVDFDMSRLGVYISEELSAGALTQSDIYKVFLLHFVLQHRSLDYSGTFVSSSDGAFFHRSDSECVSSNPSGAIFSVENSSDSQMFNIGKVPCVACLPCYYNSGISDTSAYELLCQACSAESLVGYLGSYLVDGSRRLAESVFEITYAPQIFSYYNGELFRTPSSSLSSVSAGTAPLTVNTSGLDATYVYLKCTDPGLSGHVSSQADLSFIVSPGSTVKIEVPLFDYDVYYAVGRTWYGPTHLFGDDTRFYKCDGSFDFYFDGTLYQGWELELYDQHNGNLVTEEISSAEFPR